MWRSRSRASLVSNCDLHFRAALFDTCDATLEYLPRSKGALLSTSGSQKMRQMSCAGAGPSSPIADKGRGAMRVLIAVDDSGTAESVLRAVETGIRHESAEVLVLHVLQPVEPAPPPEMAQDYAPELESQKQAAHALVEGIAGELSRAGFKAQAEVLIGDVTGTILGRAAEWNADLITVGSHKNRSIHDLLLGSVAESVARRAACSALIVRTPA